MPRAAAGPAPRRALPPSFPPVPIIDIGDERRRDKWPCSQISIDARAAGASGSMSGRRRVMTIVRTAGRVTCRRTKAKTREAAMKSKIAVLNDNLRTTFAGGQVVMTAAVNELPLDVKARVIRAVQSFSKF